MNLKRKALTGLAALGVAFGGLGVATVSDPGSLGGPQTAQAATYGKAGCIGDYKWKYTGREWYTGLKVYKETCDYRTSTGAIINDAYTGNVWKTW